MQIVGVVVALVMPAFVKFFHVQTHCAVHCEFIMTRQSVISTDAQAMYAYVFIIIYRWRLIVLIVLLFLDLSIKQN